MSTAQGVLENAQGVDRRVISYLQLRAAVGMLGMSLPLIVLIGACVVGGDGIQSSVSTYYYTSMRNVFVGILCAIAVFLHCYKGYDWVDDVLGEVSGLAALGVALFPTTPESPGVCAKPLIGALHLASAVVFFACLIVLCLVQFRKSDTADMSIQKRRRNGVYVGCGIAMAVSLLLILVHKVAGVFPESAQPVFFLEAAALLAFGISWLTKGQVILRDA